MEFFDLYDINKNNLHKRLEKGSKLPANTYRLVIHICIINNNGEMLIQQRDKSKKNFPQMWDITLGGNVQTGETSQQAAERELAEELGLQLDFNTIRSAFTINFNDGFDDYYIIKKDIDSGNVKFVDGEVQNVKWANKEEIIDMIKKSQFIKYHIPLIELIFKFSNSVNAFDI